jgi:hypothetical protein
MENTVDGITLRTERLFWNHNLRLVTTVSTDASGSFLKASSFEYGEDGRILNATTYSNEQDSGFVSNHSGENYWSLLWNNLSSALANISVTMQKFKNSVSYTNYAYDFWDYTLHGLIDDGFLRFSGYYQDNFDSGCINCNAELHDKVRITLINGILNIREDLEDFAKLLSETHGNHTVHYVFRPSEGWTKDLLSCLQSKLGFVSPQALLLAQKWKDLIQEMGGVDGGGIIIHYAHSIGATDTYNAKDLLLPEEQKMIHVITIGSPSLIPENAGFGSAVHYVSRRDGVCLLDPIGYFQGQFSENSNVHFLGTYAGIPLIDHTIYQETYNTILRELGERFLEAHQKPA